MSSTTSHRTITPSVLYFGTPVIVLSTLNEDGTTNLAPISSYWALGDLIVLGLGARGHSARNLHERRELVLNFCWDHQWEAVESLALLTGADPVPEGKADGCRFEPDKFGAAGWTPLPSTLVEPHRVTEAGAHIEARVSTIHHEPGVAVVHARALSVHADDSIAVGASHVDPLSWRPLIYNFRHYFGLGDRLGIARRAELQN